LVRGFKRGLKFELSFCPILADAHQYRSNPGRKLPFHLREGRFGEGCEAFPVQADFVSDFVFQDGFGGMAVDGFIYARARRGGLKFRPYTMRPYTPGWQFHEIKCTALRIDALP
jgi:hypothetical protein